MPHPSACSRRTRSPFLHCAYQPDVHSASRPPAADHSALFIAWTPALFVILWSTGFIGMRLGTPFAEPFTFMMWRMVIVVSILSVLVLAARAPWPGSLAEAGHIAVAGLLVHATYLSGVLYAINLKLPLGFVALIAGLQPTSRRVCQPVPPRNSMAAVGMRWVWAAW
jgi:hypothetical protein